jgi:hypothetical protein
MKSDSIAVLGASSLPAKSFQAAMARTLPALRLHLFGGSEIVLTAMEDGVDFIQPESPGALEDFPLWVDFTAARKEPLNPGAGRLLHCGAGTPPQGAEPVHILFNPERLFDRAVLSAPHPAVAVLLRLMHGLPLHALRHAHATILLSTSEEGQEGNDELFNQTLGLMNTQSAKSKIYKEQISFNLIPELDPAALGRMRLEMDLFLPTGLFHPPHLARAGTFFGTLMALDFAFTSEEERKGFSGALKARPLFKWESKRHHGLIKAVQTDDIHASVTHEEGDSLQLWIATDALSTGMAWNLAGLVEHFFQNYRSN